LSTCTPRTQVVSEELKPYWERRLQGMGAVPLQVGLNGSSDWMAGGVRCEVP